MSEIRIRDTRVFGELAEAISGVGSDFPPVLEEARNSLETFYRDLEADIWESEGKLKQIKSGSVGQGGAGNDKKTADPQAVARETATLNQKLQELKGYLSNVQHLLMRMESLVRDASFLSQLSGRSQSALQSFESVAMRYLQQQGQGTSFSAQPVTRKSDGNRSAGLRLLGDTYHFDNPGRISAMDLQNIDNEIRSNSRKGNKVSINNVSQSDFNMLESKGYTIQKIRPNEYTAYKTI